MSELTGLLREREVRGLRGALVTRLIVTLMLTALMFVIFGTPYELVLTVAACVIAAIIVALLLWLLDRRQSPMPIGVAAAAIDVAFMIALPIIWLSGVGGPDVVPMSFPVKGGLATVMLVLIVLNALALRPLYPALATAGAVVVYLGFITVAALDPRTVFTRDYAEALMGPSLSTGLLISNLVLILVAGGAVCLVTVRARQLTIDGVRLEKASAQLGRYFSPAVRDKISDANTRFLEPGGEETVVTVLFCDIRGFTALAETMTPQEVMQFLSDYHSRMVEAVFAHGGTLDKFIGDAVMATFGTPRPEPDDTERALRAGIAMRQALVDFNGERAARGLPMIKQGTGIHTGPVVVGNVGTPERLEYTVIGDTVNVASRIAAACKTTGDDLLVSEAVKEKLVDVLALRRIDPIALPGKTAPVALYAVE